MTTLPCFQLQVAPPTLGEAGPIATAAPPTTLCLDFGRKRGNFNYDREKGGYVHEWASFAEFDAWRRQEELAYSIELILSKSSSGKEFKQKQIYSIDVRALEQGARSLTKKSIQCGIGRLIAKKPVAAVK